MPQRIVLRSQGQHIDRKALQQRLIQLQQEDRRQRRELARKLPKPVEQPEPSDTREVQVVAMVLAAVILVGAALFVWNKAPASKPFMLPPEVGTAVSNQLAYPGIIKAPYGVGSTVL